MPPIYGPIEKASDVSKNNSKIRGDIRSARSQARLTELYERSKYIITLTYSPNWEKHKNIKTIRSRAKSEFHKTAGMINKKAKSLGLRIKYDSVWGKGR